MKEAGSTKYSSIASASHKALGKTYFSWHMVRFDNVKTIFSRHLGILHKSASVWVQTEHFGGRPACIGHWKSKDHCPSDRHSPKDCPGWPVPLQRGWAGRVPMDVLSSFGSYPRNGQSYGRPKTRDSKSNVKRRCWNLLFLLIFLQVILSLSCQSFWLLNGHLVVKIFSLCLSLYGTSGTGTKAAAQATCSQTASEFAKILSELHTPVAFITSNNCDF